MSLDAGCQGCSTTFNVYHKGANAKLLAGAWRSKHQLYNMMQPAKTLDVMSENNKIKPGVCAPRPQGPGCCGFQSAAAIPANFQAE